VELNETTASAASKTDSLDDHASGLSARTSVVETLQHAGSTVRTLGRRRERREDRETVDAAAAGCNGGWHQSAPRERLVRKLLRCNYKRLTPLGVDTVTESRTDDPHADRPCNAAYIGCMTISVSLVAKYY